MLIQVRERLVGSRTIWISVPTTSALPKADHSRAFLTTNIMPASAITERPARRGIPELHNAPPRSGQSNRYGWRAVAARAWRQEYAPLSICRCRSVRGGPTHHGLLGSGR